MQFLEHLRDDPFLGVLAGEVLRLLDCQVQVRPGTPQVVDRGQQPRLVGPRRHAAATPPG